MNGKQQSSRPPDCHCDYSPNSTGPEEDCPHHGRPYAHWVERSDALAARLASVEALHVQDDREGHDECVGCRDECLYCEGDHVWPCPTIRVLGSGAHTEQKTVIEPTGVRREVRYTCDGCQGCTCESEHDGDYGSSGHNPGGRQVNETAEKTRYVDGRLRQVRGDGTLGATCMHGVGLAAALWCGACMDLDPRVIPHAPASSASATESGQA